MNMAARQKWVAAAANAASSRCHPERAQCGWLTDFDLEDLESRLSRLRFAVWQRQRARACSERSHTRRQSKASMAIADGGTGGADRDRGRVTEAAFVAALTVRCIQRMQLEFFLLVHHD